ncbi:hypothetical protein [Christiangramia sp. LLG6405-1]|uniref:hypothetical protein n=1 Tax=Christiangramia sp. LLG6405-1 TaxID=3160832 RepID=UPI003865639D
MEPYSKITFNSHEKFSDKETLQQVTYQMIDIIKKYCEPISLYCFGVQNRSSFSNTLFTNEELPQNSSWHFYLLLISDRLRSNSTANLMDLLEKDSVGRISVTLICYSPTQIKSSNNEHLHFFAKVIQSGWLVYGKPYELAKLNLTNLPDLDFEGITKYSVTRIEVAQDLIKLISHSDSPVIASTLIHTVIEQLCIGMLYAFLYYHPNHFHLNFLLKLCSLFSSAPDQFFLQNAGYSETLQKMLNTSRHDLRFRNTDIYSKNDLNVLKSICIGFSEALIPCIEERLNELKIQTK